MRRRGPTTPVTTLEDTRVYLRQRPTSASATPPTAPANALTAVKITTLPGAGSLTDNGVLVNAGDFVSAADIAGGKLAVHPGGQRQRREATRASPSRCKTTAVSPTAAWISDQSANTMSIDVTAVNDAPVERQQGQGLPSAAV